MFGKKKREILSKDFQEEMLQKSEEFQEKKEELKEKKEEIQQGLEMMHEEIQEEIEAKKQGFKMLRGIRAKLIGRGGIYDTSSFNYSFGCFFL